MRVGNTLLRLPPAIFYAEGLKANFLFVDDLPAAPEAFEAVACEIEPRGGILRGASRRGGQPRD
ncbi:MAG: hypothetical protein J4F34_02565 [Gemmatimonadetes bacterium]|nr:hypothetical protein [Gemmatimonadota bacterium]